MIQSWMIIGTVVFLVALAANWVTPAIANGSSAYKDRDGWYLKA